MLLSGYLERVNDPGSGLSQAQKLQVLVDGENLLREHLKGTLQVPETELSGSTQGDGEALLPAPYDRLYELLLQAAYAWALGEETRYNNMVSLYRALLQRLDLAVMRRYGPVDSAALTLV